MLEFLKNAAETNNLAHGYLFYSGLAEEMKKTAFDLATYLNTDQFDIMYIAPRENKTEISIDQIRELKKHLSLSPYNSSYKFAIIDQAETMSQEASDALLKTLEEPQGNTILILIAQMPDLLPKTVLSRLQEIRFKLTPLNKTTKDFINEEHINLLKKPLNDIYKYIEKITKDNKENKSNNAEIFTILNSWLFWFRGKLINSEDSTKEALKALKEIQKTKDLISNTNVNQRLALENLILCINNYSTI